MANTKDFKVKNGIQPAAYHEAVGTVTSETVDFDIPNAVQVAETVNLNTIIGTVDRIDTVMFIPDGTTLIMGAKDLTTTSNYLYEINLGTAWDINTITSFTRRDDLTSQTTVGIYSLTFNDDGTKFFVSGGSSDIFEYNTSTAYRVLPADVTFVDSYDTSTETGAGTRGALFHDNGSKFIVTSVTTDSLHEYSMTTPYDISTASHNQTKDVSATITNPHAISFNDDGTELYIKDSGNKVYTCSLTTAYDISTLSVDIETQFSGLADSAMFFKPDGSRLYFGTNAETIEQYEIDTNKQTLDMSTGSVFEVTPSLSTISTTIELSNPPDSGTVGSASLILKGGLNLTYDIANATSTGVSFAIAASETGTMQGFRFGDSGSKLYLTDAAGTVFQYHLSTAYDISTMYFSGKEVAVSSEAAAPYAVDFKSDGTKMFVLDSSTDTLYQYSLSTAWDVTTATYDSVSFSVNSEQATPTHVEFKSDGTSFYICGLAPDTLFQYNMTTPWDISSGSASYASKSFATGLTNPYHFTFKPDGTEVYVAEAADIITRFVLGTAWDISTVYDGFITNDTLDVSATTTGDVALQFNGDGTKLIVGGDGGDTIDEYTTSTTTTIVYDTSIQFEEGTAPTTTEPDETDIIVFSTRDGGTSYQAAQAVDGAV